MKIFFETPSRVFDSQRSLKDKSQVIASQEEVGDYLVTFKSETSRENSGVLGYIPLTRGTWGGVKRHHTLQILHEGNTVVFNISIYYAFVV